jgi:hypothetical protein
VTEMPSPSEDFSRCPVRGCPVRWRQGPDRKCEAHRRGDDGLAARYRQLMSGPARQGAVRAAKALHPPRLSAPAPGVTAGYRSSGE